MKKMDYKDRSTWPEDGQEINTDKGKATFYDRNSWTGELSPTFEFYYELGFIELYNVTEWEPV